MQVIGCLKVLDAVGRNYSAQYLGHGLFLNGSASRETRSIGQSASADAIDRTTTIYGGSYDAWSNYGACDRPWPQHNTGPHDTPDGIVDVLAVHDSSVGILGACGCQTNCQQDGCKQDGKFHLGALFDIKIKYRCTPRDRA